MVLAHLIFFLILEISRFVISRIRVGFLIGRTSKIVFFWRIIVVVARLLVVIVFEATSS